MNSNASFVSGAEDSSRQLQLSPQIESSLGVNRVLLVVTSSAGALTTDLDVLGPAFSSKDSLLEELSASIHWLSKAESTGRKAGCLYDREKLLLPQFIGLAQGLC